MKRKSLILPKDGIDLVKELLTDFSIEQKSQPFSQIAYACHGASVGAGWWQHLTTGDDLDRNVPEMLMLIVSEVSEAMEGYRKDAQDDKLPHRKMIEVELADTMIRIFDLATAMGLDLEVAIYEKLAYNLRREDHKPENRAKAGGKKL